LFVFSLLKVTIPFFLEWEMQAFKYYSTRKRKTNGRAEGGSGMAEEGERDRCCLPLLMRGSNDSSISEIFSSEIKNLG
jgi:hypothetical protein